MITTNSTRVGGTSVSFSQSRTTGISPLLVFFDAVGTTDSSTSRPFQDLDFKWDFTAAVTGNWSTTGRAKRFAYGGSAACLFEITEGGGDQVITPTLTITTPSGATTVNLNAITVYDPQGANGFPGNNTICYSKVGTFTGAPASAVLVTNASGNFNTAITNSLAANKRVLIHDAEAWVQSAQAVVSITTGPWAIGKFGSGAAPTVTQAVDVGDRSIRVNGTGSDGRIMDLSVVGPTNGTNCGIGSNANMSKLTLLRVTVSNYKEAFVWDDGYLAATYGEIGTVECTATALGTGGGWCMFIGAAPFAIMGCTYNRQNLAGAHTVRAQYGDRSVITNNSLSNPGAGLYSFTLRAPDQFPTKQTYTQYCVLNHNIFSQGATGGPPLHIGSETTFDERLRQITVDGNFATAGVNTEFLLITSGSEITVRNNLNVGTIGSTVSATVFTRITKDSGVPTIDNIRLKQNSHFTNDSLGAGLARFLTVSDAATTNIYVQNSDAYAPQATTPDFILDSSSQGVITTPGRVSTDGEMKGTNCFVSGIPAVAADFAPANYAVGSGVFVQVYKDYNSATRVTYDVGGVKN